MNEQISIQDQWLLNGDCDECRRKSYCNSPCKARKKMIDDVKMDQKVVEIVDDLDKELANVGIDVNPLKYYNRYQELLDSEDMSVCLEGYKEVLSNAFDDMLLVLNALKAVKVDGTVEDVKAAYALETINNSVNDINDYIIGPNKIPLDIFDRTLSKTVRSFKTSK
jgi:hypothetical protein